MKAVVIKLNAMRDIERKYNKIIIFFCEMVPGDKKRR